PLLVLPPESFFFHPLRFRGARTRTHGSSTGSRAMGEPRARRARDEKLTQPKEDEIENLLARAEDVTQDFDLQDYVRPGITEAEIRAMKSSFDLIDADGKGKVNLEDAIDSLENLGWDRLEQEPLMVALRSCKRKGQKMDFAGLVG
ncbi:unnamed protein product, partial [Effrenium voratum]